MLNLLFKEHDVDILIVGGGMGSCGTAFEAVRWADKFALSSKYCLLTKLPLNVLAQWPKAFPPLTPTLAKTQQKITCAWFAQTLWALCAKRPSIFDLGRHVDDSVHLFEDWGLPCWIKGDDGHNLDLVLPPKPLAKACARVTTLCVPAAGRS